jgi:ferredoxin
VRVVIDDDLCTGHGRCFALSPELFTDDENGYGRVIDDDELAATQVDAAERAIRACPERAIRLEP